MIGSLIEPMGLSRKAAEAFVGGRTVFESLRARFPQMIQPFYATDRSSVYSREDLETAVRAARLLKRPLGPAPKDERDESSC